MNYIPPHNINVPKKGSRHTFQFRADQKRPVEMHDELVVNSWNRAFGGGGGPMPSVGKIEISEAAVEALRILYDAPAGISEPKGEGFEAALLELRSAGLAENETGLWFPTPTGIRWYKQQYHIKGLYEKASGNGESETQTPA